MSIEIKIDETTLKQLKSIAAKKRISRQAYILRSLKTSLKLDELNLIRKKMKGVASKNGFKREEDIFREIS